MGKTICRDIMRDGVYTPEALSGIMNIDVSAIKQVTDVYPMRINPYFLHLALKKGDSLLSQIIPSLDELHDDVGLTDPLAEEEKSPVPNCVHRYPDRILFLVSDECGVYCRFCTRKRRIGQSGRITDATIEEGLRYISGCRQIRDVLLSGGDPLMLSDEKLEWILAQIHAIPHVDLIRIGTRIPSVLPQRITPRLVSILTKYHPLYMHVHFNHPDEITTASREACTLLAGGGLPIGNQTVLLRGINDNPHIIIRLFRALLKMRIRPYYLHQADLTQGTNHFRTNIDSGLVIMRYLRGRISGMGIPSYVIDLPGGGGKIPLLPEYMIHKSDQEVVIHYRERRYVYPQPIHSSFNKIAS
jgi:lysine 2,3-aminomutase